MVVIKIKFVVLDSITGEFILRVDLNNCSEYNNDEYDRFIADNLDLQENILVLFDDDIDYDFHKLHQGLKINKDGSVDDIRPTKYIYTFYVEKILTDSRKVIPIRRYTYNFDDELSQNDIQELKVSLGANRVEIKYGKYPSDNDIYQIEGKLDLIKD